jgi:hypothetical protein
MPHTGFRARVLRRFGARGAQLDELLQYGASEFSAAGAGAGAEEFPLPDEPFARAWEGYAARAERGGVLPALREALVQLRFPVREGVSALPAYAAATRRGELPPEGAEPGVELAAPERLRLFLHPTPAGRIPVVVAPHRADFVTLVQALTARNEPRPLPSSMGAVVVAGYNNWGRVAELRAAWRGENPGVPDAGWPAAFQRLAPRKELYQDRFILLSEGPYSGVAAEALGLAPGEWNVLSLTIRLEHECAHYVCRRVWGSMRNAVLDEVIADYVGIVCAAGGFRAGWLLHCFGVERFPVYREGARLQNYRGSPALSDGSFAIVQAMLVEAARRLESFTIPGAEPGSPRWKAEALTILPRLTLEHLATLEPHRWARAGEARAPAQQRNT